MPPTATVVEIISALITTRLSIVIAVGLSCVTASTAQEIMNFNQLPKEVRDLAIDVRKQCKDLEPEMNFTDMQGIQILSLTGDSSRDIVVDNEDLCGEHIAELIAAIAAVT